MLAKENPSVPRHAIHGDEYFSPGEIWKVRDDIVKAARTAVQLVQNRLFYGQHGVKPPVEVSAIAGASMVTGKGLCME